MMGLAETEWAKQLPSILFELRTRRNAATGYSPGRALLGYELPRPGEHRRQDVPNPDAPYQPDQEGRQEELRAHQRRYLQRYDQPQVPARFEEGNRVMLRAHPQTDQRGNHKAFAPKWLGPYQIRESLGGRFYLVDKGSDRVVRVHADDLRLDRRGLEEPVPEADDLPEESD